MIRSTVRAIYNTRSSIDLHETLLVLVPVDVDVMQLYYITAAGRCDGFDSGCTVPQALEKFPRCLHV